MFHWLFALVFAGAYATAEIDDWRLVHVTLGYAFAGLLGFRLLYGLLGPRHARLALLWRRAAGAPDWLRSIAGGLSPGAVNWQQGPNLALACGILAMLALVAPLVLTGYGNYVEWGGDWLAEVHEFFGNAFLAAVLAHLALLVVISLLRRRNLALPMLTGYATGKGPDLVQRNRAWLAALLLLAVLAFFVWRWIDPPEPQPSPRAGISLRSTTLPEIELEPSPSRCSSVGTTSAAVETPSARSYIATSSALAESRKMGVAMSPGESALMRTPNGRSSCATHLTMPTMPALVAA